MRRIATGVMFALAACTQGAPTDEIGDADEALFGRLTTRDCTTAQISTLTRALLFGQSLVVEPEFRAAVYARVGNDYVPCTIPEYGSGATRSQQAAYVDAVTRSVNSVDITCADISPASGDAVVSTYGDTSAETMRMDRNYLNGRSDAGRASVAHVAGSIWHEAMHRHSYRHSKDDDTSCGYTFVEGVTRSVPYILSGAMIDAAVIHEATLPGGVVLAPGTYSVKTLTMPQLSSGTVTVPPGHQLMTCSSDALSGTRPVCTGAVTTITGAGTKRENKSLWTTEGAIDGAAYARMAPVAVAYLDVNYGGAAYPLDVNDHWSMSDFPNDAVRSIYIPAGLRVTACPNGPNDGGCATFESPVADTWLGGISFIRVEPRAVGYAGANYTGARTVYGEGEYFQSNGTLSPFLSIIIPPELGAYVCTGDTTNPYRRCGNVNNSSNDISPQFGARTAITYLHIWRW